MSDMATDLAVLKAEFKGHVELDNHQFAEQKADLEHIKAGVKATGDAYQRGTERIHTRLDETNKDLGDLKVSIEGVANNAKRAIGEGLQGMKVWIYSQAVAVLVFILVFVLREMVIK